MKNYSNSNEKGKPAYDLYRFQGIHGDFVTLKYFIKTNRLQIQGKPLYLFNDILALISETIESVDEMVDSHLEMCCVNVKKDEIYEEMEKVLGKDVYSYFPNTHKAILASTFIQFRIQLNLTDYSCVIYPAYRAFEGFIRKIFDSMGLNCIGKKNIGEFFYKNENDTFIMKSEFSRNLADEKVKTMTKMYVFYNKNRNVYAHASGDDFNTVIISSRDVAYNNFIDVIKYIKEGYTIVQ